MFASDFFANRLLNVFRGNTAAGAGTLFVGLFFSSPTDTGTAGVEVAYTGYTRQQVNFTPPYSINSDTAMAIAVDNNAQFPTPDSDVGSVHFIGIFDSQIPGSGNMWAYGELTIPLDIRASQKPVLRAGNTLFFSHGDFTMQFKADTLNIFRGINLLGFEPHMALFSGDPEAGGGELAGMGYARPLIGFNAPEKQVGGQKTIIATDDVVFPDPLGNWGVSNWSAIMDAANGGRAVVKLIRTVSEEFRRDYVAVFPADTLRVSYR